MPVEAAPAPHASRLAALFSALVPGAGQALKQQFPLAAAVFLVTAGLLGCAWLIAHAGRLDTAVFFLTILVLPWWVFQAYNAYLPATSGHAPLLRTWRTVWTRAHDIRFLGGLFLLSALMDFYLILAQPEYALTVFCTKPSGPWGILAKAQSPSFHLLIGYGFLRLRRWSLLIYLLYAGFGLANATANFACFGFGRIRSVFLVTLAAFTAYVIWRREVFAPAEMAQPPL